MKVKNSTPFLFGPKVTSRRPPQPEMTLVVRGAFTIRPGEPLAPLEDQGALTAELFAPDDDERRGECLYPGDFADYKLNAEVMLRGTCYPPSKRPVTDCMVRFAVGAWSKLLRVVGPRAWSDRMPGAVPSQPLSFTEQRLDYAQSFGGPGYAKNPAGQGFETDKLPCVESPAAPVRSRRDRPEPAGFGPLNPGWAPRAGKVGKEYGRAYREKRAPYHPEDFDWTYFHAAPADQQLKGYLRGDEQIVLEGLHPEAPSVSFSLPGVRVRAFVKDARARFREVAMSLDTLFVDADEGVLFLTWRGLEAVEEDDLADVSVVRVAAESMTDERVPAERYAAEIEAFEADPLGLRAVLPPALVEIAERTAAEERGEASRDEPELGSSARTARLVEGFVSSLPGKSAAEVDAMMAGSGASPGLRDALLKATGGGAAPPLIPLKPGSAPVVKVGPRLRAVLAQVDVVKRQAAERGQVVRGLERVDALVGDPRLRAIDPTFKPPRPDDPPPEEPGPGRNLVGQDLSGRDLHGVDLTGANLEGAILTRANLRDARLARANLAYAVLYEADLSGADLTEADLTKAQVARASAIGARFDGATLEQASFERADLTGASLARASGAYVRFSKANLTRVKAPACALPNSHFDDARLEGADFTGASLTSCLLRDARARGVTLAQAKLTRASFEGADLRGAILTGARGDKIAWMRAKLDDADLRHSWMTGAHFIETSANRASFTEANLKEARFYKATMESASFARANLLSADFGKARLTGSSFAGANLYDAKFLRAAGKGCDFADANLKRSTLETQR
ncbi:MAG TPA: DUF2169 domain-containing protein [Byssovorax sp.]